mgnify:CR=1 FL=1
MLYSTFRLAREANACKASYRKFAKFKGGVREWGEDNPFPLTEVLDVCGLDDAFWSLSYAIKENENERDRIVCLFACDCAERVLPLFEKVNPEDKRPRAAIETSRKFISGEATQEELAAARAAARAAAWVASDATWAARAAAWAASDAAWAASDAASAASAARAATWAASDARAATWAASDASDTARAAERQWQKGHVKELLEGE